MNDPSDEAILSREELDALLESLGAEAGVKDWGSVARSRVATVALQRCNEAFAEEVSRSLSNVHQTPIALRLISSREIEQVELGEMILDSDVVASFSVGPLEAVGHMVVGRPLLFSLMCLKFGASPALKRYPTPDRRFTKIELRFYRRFVEDLMAQLDREWSTVTPVRSRVLGLFGREYLFEDGHERLVLATFDVRGFGEVCRLRLAVPLSPFAEIEAGPATRKVAGGSVVESRILEMPLDLSVEIGSTQVPISQVAGIAVDDLIELEGSDDGSMVVRIAGEPKFRAIRGAVGSRLAVQLTERL